MDIFVGWFMIVWIMTGVRYIQVRNALKKAEKELDGSQRAPLAHLQHWLQLNYEIENKHFEMKKESAEKELEYAKEMVGCKCWD